MPDIPIVVLGAGGVGKSCLTIQYVQGHFVDKYDATIEDVYRKPIDIDGQPAVLTVVDTAGQDTFGAMRDQYMRKGQGFVLVYSITDMESFAQVQRIYSQLRRIRGPSTPAACVLVGNKTDQEPYRAVSREKGRQLAAEVFQCPFMEVTAKDHRMAEEIFEMLVRTIRNDGVPPISAAGAGSASPAQQAPSPNERGPAGSPRSGPARNESAAETPPPSEGSPKKKKRKRCTLL